MATESPSEAMATTSEDCALGALRSAAHSVPGADLSSYDSFLGKHSKNPRTAALQNPSRNESHDNTAPTAKYTIVQRIKSGHFGQTYMIESNPLHPENAAASACASPTIDALPQRYVAKEIDLERLSDLEKGCIEHEINCMKIMSGCISPPSADGCAHHPHVIRFVESRVVRKLRAAPMPANNLRPEAAPARQQNTPPPPEKEVAILILEMCNGGDIHFQHQQGVTFTEDHIGNLMFQLLLALHHIHQQNIIHRDIKTANLMVTTDGFLKVGDFGFARRYEGASAWDLAHGVERAALGTPYYQAPELYHHQPYGNKVDIWAAGVVLYEMLHRRMPFNGRSPEELATAVVKGEVPEMPTVSEEMADLVRMMLTVDPVQRPDALTLLRTPTMQRSRKAFCDSVLEEPGFSAYGDLKRLSYHLIELLQAEITKIERQPANLMTAPVAVARLPTNPHGIQTVAAATRPVADSTSLRSMSCETFVKNGTAWKKRVLSLDDGALTIALPSHRRAMQGRPNSVTIKVSDLAHFSANQQAVPLHELPSTTATPLPEEQQRTVTLFTIDLKTTRGQTALIGFHLMEIQQHWFNALSRN